MKRASCWKQELLELERQARLLHTAPHPLLPEVCLLRCLGAHLWVGVHDQSCCMLRRPGRTQKGGGWELTPAPCSQLVDLVEGLQSFVSPVSPRRNEKTPKKMSEKPG